MSESRNRQETEQEQTITPTPDPRLRDGTYGLQDMIDRLRGRDPNGFVAPASPLQNQAFGLAGGLAQRMGGALPAPSAPAAPTVASSAPRPASNPVSERGPGPDFGSYVDNHPDLQRELGRLNGDFARNATLDRNGDGRIGRDEYGEHHWNRFGEGEGRILPYLQPRVANTNTPAPAPAPAPEQTGNVAPIPIAGPNPADYFEGAGLLAGAVGEAGPNTVGNASHVDLSGSLIDVNNLRERDVSSMTAASLLDNLDAYMNPYIDDVVNSSLANYDRESGKRGAELAARAAGTNAFAGSRYGVAEGEFNAVEGLKRALLESGLRSDAFNTGAALSGQDASRRQEASRYNAEASNMARAQEYQLYGSGLLANLDAERSAASQNAAADNNMSQFDASQRDAALIRQLQSAGLLGDLGATIGAEDRANIGLLAALGDQQRGIDSAFRGSEATLAQIIAALQSAQPLGTLTGQYSTGTGTSNSTTTQGAAGTLAGLGGAWLMGGGGNPFG